MKKLLSLLFILTISSALMAQTGKVSDNLSMQLHGAGDDQTGWVQFGEVLNLIENIPDDLKKAVRWYIDCGDDDFLFEGNSLMHIAMRKKEIPHEFRIRDGAHNWTYWRVSLPKVIEFVSMSFHQF